MKKLYIISLLVISIVLVGCGNKNTNTNYQTTSKKQKEITLKEALKQEGTHIWYIIDTDTKAGYQADKDDKGIHALIFKDGKVIEVNILRKIDPNKEKKWKNYEELTLGEISKMTDDEILKAVETTREYFEDLKKEDSLYATEALEEMEYKDFTLKILTDNTGNNVKTEMLYIGDKQVIFQTLNHYIMSGYGPTQVYDTYFCGYYEYDFADNEIEDRAFVTKCDTNTTYTFDKIGTKDIIVE